MKPADKIIKITKALDETYGKRPAFKRSDPVDELVRTILSQNTSDKNSVPAFYALKKRFGAWERVLGSDTRKIAAAIRHAGLANIKAKRIKEVLAEIKRREGSITLAVLKDLSVEEGASYLRSLKGVGPKTAACVLLFGFGKPAMPVDTHIFRVAKRLGLIGGVSIEEAHETLSRIVPNHLIYDLHLGIIEHGRKTCRAQNPLCGVCLLYGLCVFKDKAGFRKRKA
ncbi:MAG: endonuclease III [Candidatus Omnitrophica bacterium]|nr:endonuclease III [Candidatus Omnitrophota bacterium]